MAGCSSLMVYLKMFFIFVRLASIRGTFNHFVSHSERTRVTIRFFGHKLLRGVKAIINFLSVRLFFWFFFFFLYTQTHTAPLPPLNVLLSVSKEELETHEERN